MIELNLGIGKGDVDQFYFKSSTQLTDFIIDIKNTGFKSVVWLVSDGGENAEILVTEDLEKVVVAIAHDHFDNINLTGGELYLFENTSYDDAYAVAYDMREGNYLQNG